MGVDIFFVADSWVEASIQLEGGIAGVGIFGIIIDEFSHRQESCLVILLVVDKRPEIGLHCTILPFNLAISLGVKGGRESFLDS